MFFAGISGSAAADTAALGAIAIPAMKPARSAVIPRPMSPRGK